MLRLNFVGIIFAIAASGAAALDIPRIGDPTGDGFTVAAHWAFHYYSRAAYEEKAIGGPMRSLDAPLCYAREVKGDADVTEEVNKTNGKIRAKVRGGHWTMEISNLHYTDKYGTRSSAGEDASGSGNFKNAAIAYGYDDKLKKPTVSFAISASDDIQPPQVEVKYHPLDEKGFDVWVSGDLKTEKFDSGVGGGCTVPFKQSHLSYRKRTPEDRSALSYTEIVIERLPRTVEAEIKPADNYKKWVPALDGVAAFEVRIVDPPGLPADWQISLEDVSHLTGVCNNANIDDFPALAGSWQHAIKKDSPDLLFDFRKYGKTDKNFKPISAPWKELHTAKPVSGASVAVSCLDWGASGRISAKAWVDEQPVEAKCRETNENFIRIPWATSADLDNKMAAAATTWRGDKKYTGDPNADNDNTPAGKTDCKGDGLTLFDEYRGFYVRGIHETPVFMRLDPDRKDLFVYMFKPAADFLWVHVPDFAEATELDVHRIGDDHLRHFVDVDTRIINFNSEHRTQHGLYMTVSKLPRNTVGQCGPRRGPPKYVDAVEFDWRQCLAGENFQPGFFKSTVIHELGHALSIAHHGHDYYVSAAGEIVAVEGGEFSGDEGCAMKYTVADYYLHHTTGPITVSSLLAGPTLFPYDPKQIEKVGLAFCTSPHGTGLNDMSKPDWQCGDATLGICRSQIVVNDFCGGGGAGSEKRIIGGEPRTDRPPTDEAERSAIESQQRANLSFDLDTGRGRMKTILPGEAALLEINLSMLDAKDAVTFGTATAPWTQQVEFLTADAAGKLVAAPVKLRQAGKVSRVTLGANPHVLEEKSPQIKPGTEEQITVTFAMEGSDSEKSRPGPLRIFAALPAIAKSGVPPRLLSNSVVIQVQDLTTLPPDEQKRIEPRRLLSQTELAFADERFADAEALARKVIALMPESAEAHRLLARSLEKQNKLREAYNAYRASLAADTPDPGAVPEPPLATMMAVRDLERKLNIERKPVTATVDMFFSHQLYAETPTGKVTPPFSRTVTRLGFSWKSALPAANDPFGVRWIAEDVPGAEKNHVISTAKSDPQKTEGEFSLTKPSAGFPPGKYRLEIWQTGKMIYSEKFEIKSE